MRDQRRILTEIVNLDSRPQFTHADRLQGFMCAQWRCGTGGAPQHSTGPRGFEGRTPGGIGESRIRPAGRIAPGVVVLPAVDVRVRNWPGGALPAPIRPANFDRPILLVR